jgi:NAD(P)H dehydrogenase (quinone)
MILVTGATGSIGRYLVRRLKDDQAPFRALVRDERKGRALGCDFVVGDFDDPDSVAAAMEGVDRLFLNAGGAQPTTGEQPMIRQQKTAIDAAREAGVGKIVKVSVWGAREGGKLATGAHWQIEQHLKTTGMDWAVLQPGGFMQNFITGAGALTDDGNLIGAYRDSRVSYIDCYDIAACAVVLLTGTHGNGESFVLTGPEALTHTEIAEKLSAALGRIVKYVELSADKMAANLKAQGLPPQFADDVVALWDEVAAGSLAATTTTVKDLTGREPRTFDEFLANNHDAAHGPGNY